jgi:signal transduction histidine kinase
MRLLRNVTGAQTFILQTRGIGVSMSVFETSWSRRLAAVPVSLGCSSFLALILRPVLHNQAQLLPFTLAVLAASSYGGLVPGLITTALSFILADFFFVEPIYRILTTPAEFALLAVFGLFGISLSVLNHRLAKARLAVEERSQQIARSNDELQRFAHSVAHDLQEPLRGVTALTELFLAKNRAKLDADAARLLDTVVESALRMKSLIEAILAFSTAIDNAGVSQFDARAVVDAAIGDLQTAIEESGAQVHIKTLPLVVANERQLGRVFLNLIGNAIKYRNKPGYPQITISADSLPNEWVFSVRDNGIGIPVKDRERIFETFQRLNRRSREGHGLGLATCKRIVEQHGGRIWVHPGDGPGTEVRFMLPRSSPPPLKTEKREAR